MTAARAVAGAATLIVLALALAAGPLAAQTRESIAVDAHAPTQPFPHFWEHMFGSGRAVLSLRESYREDLRAVREVTAVSYVRFHAILHDEMGVYNVGPHGEAARSATASGTARAPLRLRTMRAGMH